MKRTVRALLLASLATSLFSLAHADSTTERADGSNAFGFKLWRELAATSDQNAAISPISLQETFALLYGGTGPEVGREFVNVLHFDRQEKRFETAMTNLLKTISSAARESNATLERSNRLWVDKAFPLNTTFEKNLKSRYGAEATQLNFRQHSEAARQIINAKIAEETHDRIENLIPPSGININTRLILTNAIYFRADWNDAFNPGSTRKENFRLANGKEVSVDTMVTTEHFPYTETASYKAIALPYRGERFAMLWVVPKKRDGLKKVEAAFQFSDFKQTIFSLAHRETTLFLPKFSFTTDTIPLREPLQNLGMKQTFTLNGTENFPRLYASNGKNRDREPLMVSNVFQKTFIKVDEKGTEAASATASDAFAASIEKPPIELRIDHPSLFFIYEIETDAILFMGRLAQP